MLTLTFLSADRPLVKSYSLKDGKLEKESYPRISEFTSHVQHDEAGRGLDFLVDCLRLHAGAGRCLLKGNLARPLVHESRTGSTDANSPTSVACLDLDRGGKYKTFDELLSDMGLGDVSYVLQYSASYGVEPERGLTGHAFLLFDQPMLPAGLKQWLIGTNLSLPKLAESIELTKTNNALLWPLDVTTCQNDKLLYIAPPTLGEGVPSGYQGERIVLVRKDRECVRTAGLAIPTAQTNRIGTEAKLDELRAAASLPKRKWVTTVDKQSGLDILSKPDAATLTGLKSERGFVYLNLNGGNSWGYFHTTQNPEVIKNFKGEPNYLTEELLPEYWATVRRTRIKEDAVKRNALENPDIRGSDPIVLAFRDFRSAVYYNGVFDPKSQRLELARASSELQLQHFLKQHGQPRLESVPIWDLVYDPHSFTRIDPAARTINQFVPSIYMRGTDGGAGDFPAITRLLRASVGESVPLRDHFTNWVACQFKHRVRTMLGWALHGVEGTGKGLLVNKVLIPLLGPTNVAIKRMQELEDQFNGYLENSLLVVVDEAQISESRQSKMIMANLKNQITEPQVSVRKMHTASYLVQNYCNFLFLSNMGDPIVISPTDRRFNVGEFRTERFIPDDAFIRQLNHELVAFSNYLHAHAADLGLARTVLDSPDRDLVRAISTNSLDQTAQALLKGDLEYFWDALPAGDVGVMGIEQQAVSDAYVRLIHTALQDREQKLTRDEIRVLLAYNVGDMPKTPAKFTSLLRHHRISLFPIRLAGKLVRGIGVTWNFSPEWARERLDELGQKVPALSNVIPLKEANR